MEGDERSAHQLSYLKRVSEKRNKINETLRMLESDTLKAQSYGELESALVVNCVDLCTHILADFPYQQAKGML